MKMVYMNYIKKERLPTSWCPGCGLGIMLRETAKVFDKLKLNRNNTVVVSGIGCAGRAAGYFNLDSVHGLHGRAIPLAEGIKKANEKLNVLVFSGDGDLMGIGGNHLLHTSRRNINMAVICSDNEITGMTGGQMSPTTKQGIKTLTSPYGSNIQEMNVKGILKSNKNYFYAKTSVFHIEHLNRAIEQAIKWNGFSFVDVIENCIVNNGRRLGFENSYEMLISYRKNFRIKPDFQEFNENELGMIRKKEK